MARAARAGRTARHGDQLEGRARRRDELVAHQRARAAIAENAHWKTLQRARAATATIRAPFSEAPPLTAAAAKIRRRRVRTV